MNLSFRWNDLADTADAAAFAGETISQSPEYISHGEIQTGLSNDGKTWVGDLAERYAADFADLEGRDLLVYRDGQGRVCAMLIIAWEESSRRRFAVIKDMAVDPATRIQGIGGDMLERAERRVRERGIEWGFLESGLHNEAAHSFFEKAGFTKTSHIFAHRLA